MLKGISILNFNFNYNDIKFLLHYFLCRDMITLKVKDICSIIITYFY